MAIWIDPELKKWATPLVASRIDMVNETGAINSAVRKYGFGERQFRRSMQLLRQKAALQGYSPEHDMTKTVPDSHFVKGVSTQYNADGEINLQWVKSEKNKEDLHNAILEYIDGIKEEIPKAKIKKITKAVRKGLDPDLLSAILIGDAHIGMLAWAKETLDGDFDTDIAVSQLNMAVDHLVNAAPPAKTGLLVNVGDWFHANDPSNATPGGGNKLDVDGRHFRNIKAGAMCQRYCIEKMLSKHDEVVVINAKGNHDSEAAVYFNMIMQAHFENEPRVTIQDTIGDFNYYRFGKCLIQVNHGDKNKVEKLAALMAKHRRGDWAECLFKYCWIGHIHHKRAFDITELDVEVEAFRNLAPSDAWHSEHGYQSPKAMTQKTLHRNFGVISEMQCNLSMLEANWKR